MTKTATKPQNLVVYMVLENTTSGMAAGLTDMGPLYNDATEGTLVEIIRLTRFDWGKFEQEFEEIPILDRPQVLRHPTREDATLTFEVPAVDDSLDAELSAAHLLWAARYFAMGCSGASGTAGYNFIEDTASDKAADLLGYAVEVVQYADDAHTAVQFRRRIHNCFLSVKPSYNAAGKLTKVEVTVSDARYNDQDDSDVAATHSDA